MRDRNYYREKRAYHIQRKKKIVENWSRNNQFYRHDGQYSKGKIHCSCPMCREKDYFNRHIETTQEKKVKDEMLFELAELDSD